MILVQELDVTEREDARRRLERSEVLLSGVLTGSADGIMAFCPVVGADGAVYDFECRLANPAAGRILGRDHTTLPGQTLTALFSATPGLLDGCHQVVLTGEGLETTVPAGSPGAVPLVLKIMPLNGGFTLCLSPLPCGNGGGCERQAAAPLLPALLDRLAATGLNPEQAALLTAIRQAAGVAPPPPATGPIRLDRLSSWAQHRGGRLLVVDDSATNRMVTGAVLGKAGFTVQLAASGEEAVRMVADAADPPEAVLMDIAMPGMDGMAATAAIRALPGGRGRLPIIAVTAHADPEDRERCLEAGLDDYLPKPVVKVELLAALERWLTP